MAKRHILAGSFVYSAHLFLNIMRKRSEFYLRNRLQSEKSFRSLQKISTICALCAHNSPSCRGAQKFFQPVHQMQLVESLFAKLRPDFQPSESLKIR